MLACAGLLTVPAATGDEPGCAPTTLEATVGDRNADGALECGPGESIVVRRELAEPRPDRVRTRRPIVAVLTLADFQLPDEESPLRGEFLDKCFEENPARSGFRPQETVLAHMVNSHIRAANRIIATGSPVLGAPIDSTFLLGDLAENQHANEVAWVLALMNGGTVDTDTGTDGYDGVQGNDPAGRGDLVSPVAQVPILDLANEAFLAPGLRSADGRAAPWFAVMGNHDTKVQGTVPDDMPGWRSFARSYALGSLKFQDLAPDRQQEACAVATQRPADLPAFLQDLFTDAAADPASAGTVRIVPPDAGRVLLNKEEWIAAFARAPGEPAGHGFAPGRRCPDVYDDPYATRACYSVVRQGVHFVVLDGNPAEGLDGGNIDAAQMAWLEAQLRASSRAYFRPDGARVANPGATDRPIVILSHHPLRRFDNTGMPPGTSSHHTADELSALLLRFPNVIAHLAGHSHENEIRPHRNAQLRTAYWEVNTAAIADWPNQSRAIEIADNRDGTLSILTTVFDGAVEPDARTISWAGADPTDETAAGLPRDVNEDWLAALGWETAFHDPQQSSAAARAVAQGERNDRNAELVLPAPPFLAARARTASATPAPGASGPVLPATGGGAIPAGLTLIALAVLAGTMRSRTVRR